MKTMVITMLIGLMTVVCFSVFADDDSLGRRRPVCNTNCTCYPPDNYYDNRYSFINHVHTYDDLELGAPLVLRPRPKPKGETHCRLTTYGEHLSHSGRCLYAGDVVTSVVGGNVYCSRTVVQCDFSDSVYRGVLKYLGK